MRDLVRRLIVSLTLLGLVTAPPMAAAAQDDAGSVPGARDCTVEPRTEEEILAIVATATPVAYDTYEEEQAAEWSDVTVLLIDVLSVLTLSDGRVVAVVVFDSQDVATPVEAFAFYFEEVDGRWLLDGVAL